MRLVGKLLMVSFGIWLVAVMLALVLRSLELGKILKDHPEIYCRDDSDCVLSVSGSCCEKTAINKRYFDKTREAKTVCTMVCPKSWTVCLGNICQKAVERK